MKLNINTWRIAGLAVLLFCSFYFFKIVVYLGISVLLYLIGHPLAHRLTKLKIGKYRLPSAIASLLTISVMVAAMLGLFFLLVPPLVNEVHYLSQLNFGDVLHNLLENFPAAKKLLHRFGDEEALETAISTQVNSRMNTENITYVLDHAVNYFTAALGGTLCILFITFFLLKDEGLVREGILLLTPSGFEEASKDIMRTSKRMLSKYFVSLLIDMLIVGVAVFITMTTLHINNALIIAFCAALFNIVPYIGAMITMSVALLIGITSCISLNQYDLILPSIEKIFFGLLCINLSDAFLVQPYLFSNSVKAHPLEIFIVTLMAGIIAGVLGMIVALPAYTIIRIVAAQFFTNLKFFRKISDNISH
jgi:predicted PurR-regulated permease PerM